jgi:hypothetical protein
MVARMNDLRQNPHYSKRVSLCAWVVGGVLGWAMMTGIGYTLWGVGEGVIALWNDPQQTIPVASSPWPSDAEITRILAITPASGSISPNR